MLEELFESCLQIEPTQQTVEALKPIPSCKGVLLFAGTDDIPIQLLIAANLRRTATARLFTKQPENEPVKKRENIAEIVGRIYYHRCYNDFRSQLKYCDAARTIYPNRYDEVVKLPRQSYVKIDTKAKWPCFSLTDKPTARKEEKIFGPFPSRRSAAEFIKILQNAFSLCQEPRLINLGKEANSCPYLQMGKCPAPCVGKISRSEYLEKIADAVLAAGGNIKKQTEKLQDQMEQLAKQQKFEQAQAVKKQLDQLDLLSKDDYRWTTELSDLVILHIDVSAKIAVPGKRKKKQNYSAFLIRKGQVIELKDFCLENTDEFYQQFIEAMASQICSAGDEQIKEQLAISCYLLYRQSARGVWINCSGDYRPAKKQITDAADKSPTQTDREPDIDKAALSRIMNGGSCKAETLETLLNHLSYEIRKKKPTKKIES